ncbi:MAG: ATP synthase F1 subunit delta [Actinomycetota bacterium]
MADKDALVRGYAEALFRIAEAEGELDLVEGQLYAFAKLLEQQTRVREALIDPKLPAENKRGLIRDALGEHANPNTVSLLGFLAEQGHARELGRIVESLAEVSAEGRRRALAEVRSAVPLNEGQRARLAEALSRATGRQVEVRVVVDPSVLGGVIAQVGDEIFDGSVKSRLDEAKQHLGA